MRPQTAASRLLEIPDARSQVIDRLGQDVAESQTFVFHAFAQSSGFV
jgi:hypothetical protein